MTPEHAWVNWWSRAWRDADADWFPPALRFLDRPRLDTLARGHHASLGRQFGITPCMPPRPRAVVQSLLCGPAARRGLTYRLVESICSPLTYGASLDPEQRAWCQSIAKALRPGHWLAREQDPLVLLGAWLGDATWQRARLQLPRARVQALENSPLVSPPPANRLDTLWQSACWMAERSLSAATVTETVTEKEPADARPAFA